MRAAAESAVGWFNGLGLWSCEQGVWGKRMSSRTFDRWLYLLLHQLGVMGRADRRYLSRLAKPGMTVIDVGANVGLYSLLMADLVGNAGCVHAFEPDPELSALLRANCGANKASNVHVHAIALGSRSERLVLNRFSLNSGDNYLGPSPEAAFRSPVDVVVEPLGGVLPGIHPDLIKVDVQGWELKVLRGMAPTLRDSSPLVHLELWPEGLSRAGDTPSDIFGFFDELGYGLSLDVGAPALSEAAFGALARGLRGKSFVNLLAARRDGPGGRHSGAAP
ncbi:MAG TPA: FkbM family methyltransferase [Opitutaceae bacterium]|jgi:FkbM family methyltransferase